MRSLILGTAWFAFVFIVGFIGLFPVDAVVSQQVAALEARTGVRLRWTGARWSLWRSQLEDVTVTDAAGQTWLRLSRLDARPRLDGVHLQGQAEWGAVGSVIRVDSVELDVDGYPVPPPPSGALQDGRLRAHVVLMQAKSSAQGTFNLSGRGRLDVYEGPIDLSGSFAVGPAEGQASLEVLGDRLRGHGELTVTATEGRWRGARLSGPLRIERKGAALTLRFDGTVDNPKITL